MFSDESNEVGRRSESQSKGWPTVERGFLWLQWCTRTFREIFLTFQARSSLAEAATGSDLAEAGQFGEFAVERERGRTRLGGSGRPL